MDVVATGILISAFMASNGQFQLPFYTVGGSEALDSAAKSARSRRPTILGRRAPSAFAADFPTIRSPVEFR